MPWMKVDYWKQTLHEVKGPNCGGGLVTEASLAKAKANGWTIVWLPVTVVAADPVKSIWTSLGREHLTVLTLSNGESHSKWLSDNHLDYVQKAVALENPLPFPWTAADLTIHSVDRHQFN